MASKLSSFTRKSVTNFISNNSDKIANYLEKTNELINFFKMTVESRSTQTHKKFQKQ